MSVLFFILLNFNLLTLGNHPVHVTVTNIEYSENDNEFSIAVKLFIDDFETIIKQKYDVELNLNTDNELKNSEYYITNYISENFEIDFGKNTKKSKKFEFEKKICSDIDVWIYFSYKSNDDFKKVEIKNSLMTDLYQDQTNLLIFNYFEFEKALKFDNLITFESFDIQ